MTGFNHNLAVHEALCCVAGWPAARDVFDASALTRNPRNDLNLQPSFTAVPKPLGHTQTAAQSQSYITGGAHVSKNTHIGGGSVTSRASRSLQADLLGVKVASAHFYRLVFFFPPPPHPTDETHHTSFSLKHHLQVIGAAVIPGPTPPGVSRERHQREQLMLRRAPSWIRPPRSG